MDYKERTLLLKINGEYDEFKSRITERGAEAAFDAAGQISVKADFKGLIETTKFNPSELEKLLLCENLLDELYMKWLTYDDAVECEMSKCLSDFLTEHGAFRLHPSP